MQNYSDNDVPDYSDDEILDCLNLLETFVKKLGDEHLAAEAMSRCFVSFCVCHGLNKSECLAHVSDVFDETYVAAKHIMKEEKHEKS